MKRFAPGWLLALSLAAQPGGSLSAPALGLVFDAKAGVLRPVLGVPGASYVGAPLEHALELRLAVVAPNGRFALAVAADDSLLLVTPDQRLPLAFALPAPERIRFNAAGDHAALARGASLDVLSLRGSEITVKWSAAVEQDGPLAVDAAGETVYAASGGRLLAIRQGGHDVQMEAGEIRSVEVAGERVIVAAGSGVLTGGGEVLLAAEDVTAALPLGDRLLVARRGGELAWLGSDGVLTPWAACPCAPTRLERQLEGRLLRLNALGQDTPLWMAEPVAGETRVFFAAVTGGGAADK